MKYVLMVLLGMAVGIYGGFIIMEIGVRKQEEPDSYEEDQEQKEFLERWEDDHR